MIIDTSSSTDVVSGGGTNSICQRTGPYVCNARREIVVIFQRGDRFPPAPSGQSTTWSIVRETDARPTADTFMT
jgi:hypothetical protein